jgi:hypothetical protein
LTLGAAQEGKVGAPLAREEFGAPSGLASEVLAWFPRHWEGVEGLVDFGDSSPSGALFVEESGLMSWALCTEVHKLQIDQV